MKKENLNSFTVAGIGELLWDVYPDGKRLGGAPLNFSFHCHQLGATAYPVSSVGADDLGFEICDDLSVKKLPVTFVKENLAHPTGTVQVTLEKGKPTYDIREGVAWDNIEMTNDLETLAQNVDAVFFDSLAQRNPVSRAAIHAFVDAVCGDALKIFDVNLRQTFFSEEIINVSLEHANILKLSDEELPVMAEMFGIAGPLRQQLSVLREKFDLKLIAYTRGADGSILVTEDNADEFEGCPCDVIDTVGAGDSFMATLCMGLLHKQPLSEINKHANQVAAFVCSQNGATPDMPSGLRV